MELSKQPPTIPIRQRDLSRDQRIQIQILHGLGWPYTKIVKHYNHEITFRQVQRACTSRPTPQKTQCGRKPFLDTASRKILVDFVCASAENRRLPFREIPLKLGWAHISERAIRLALQKEGFARRVTRRKPPISEANRALRLAWAREHRDWTKEQWKSILWSDETWISGLCHRKIWVT